MQPPIDRNAPERDAATAHVASLETLARAAIEAAAVVERAVIQDQKHADRTLARLLRDRHDLGQPDKMFVTQAVYALFRWKGWLDPLPLDSPDARLLFAWLLDSHIVHPVCKVWARAIGRDPARLFSLGGAPNWTARAEGWKRLHEGIPVTADPWRLFPAWLREHLPLAPGAASPKLKNLELLNALQSRPSLWVRAQGAEPKKVWESLGELGLRPWIHRRVLSAAKLSPESNVHHVEPFKKGRLEIQDLASQAVGLACDPDPGERWWDACAGAGGKALHLSALMQGKGLVVATDVNESKLKETVRRARRSPFRNVTTKVWDGKHVAGKAASYDGVLVDAPCSALGTWRRNPDARWTLDRQAIPRLAELQAQLLRAAAAGVKPGGTLVYSVCTLTPAETTGVVRPFLAERPEFQLDPFPHPLSGAPTDGTMLIWPQESDNDAMFVARMVRTKG
jgi:16S rRNA (cytosine967-C5)-methyltransferase